MAQYKALLQDEGQVDSPLLARLGYPIILVSTTKGRKFIPVAQIVPVGNNPQNNRMATVAASRVSTGLALGCVVGNVYALRKDGKDLTAKEWDVLWDALEGLMDTYGDGPSAVNDRVLREVKADVKTAMCRRGLKASGTSAGVHCWACGIEGDEDLQLRVCSACHTARYCSKECQLSHWKRGHKEECKPKVRPKQAEADKVKQLMEAAVLKPEQIIQRNAPVPRLPVHLPAEMAQMAAVMPPDDMPLLMYNRRPGNKERICPACKTHYRLQKPSPDDQCAREQVLSGICSYRCWCAFNPPGSQYAAPEWYGQSAASPQDHGVQLRL